MIELICRNNNPQLGMVRVILRFVGLNIFIKSNINAQAQTLVNQFKQRGAEVECIEVFEVMGAKNENPIQNTRRKKYLITNSRNS